MNSHKIPWEELSGNKNLSGKYKVSFILELSEEDEISLTDIAHSITAGFDGHPVLNKISHLDLEKTYKDGSSHSQRQADLRPGDSVVINKTVEIKAEIENYNGRYLVGSRNLETERLGETLIKVPAGLTAKVNQITEDGVELVDFSNPVLVPLENVEYNIIEDVPVMLNNVIFSNINIDRLMEEK